jgi:RNA 2',3'-cyclic 3'-phosphodiesterase
VKGAASVIPGERLRLFCALRLPSPAAATIAAWQREVFAQADVRIVGADQLHLTLAFLGSRPAEELGAIAAALGEAAASVDPPLVRVSRYRETRAVGMLVCSDEADRAATLARGLHERLERLGVYRPERRPWLPHVTVVRFRRGTTGPRVEALPALEAVVTSEAAVYMSVLRPSGAQYEVLQTVAVGRR